MKGNEEKHIKKCLAMIILLVLIFEVILPFKELLKPTNIINFSLFCNFLTVGHLSNLNNLLLVICSM